MVARETAPRLIDISPLLSEATAVFPGDVPLRRRVAMAFDRGDHLALSSVETTVHLGAHADAPSHYHAGGAAISERPLELYYGPCQVIAVDLPRGTRIEPAHLGVAVSAPRVLLKTGSFPNPNQWCDDFNALSAPLVAYLAASGVRLIGIDTPSVDLAHDKELVAHAAVFAHDLAVLEGLVLDAVPPGRYTLVALPLKLAGADAAPVRAALIEEVPT